MEPYHGVTQLPTIIHNTTIIPLHMIPLPTATIIMIRIIIILFNIGLISLLTFVSLIILSTSMTNIPQIIMRCWRGSIIP